MDINYLEDEVVRIETIEEKALRYDITVEGNHNFFANGILVHNCENLVKEVFVKRPDEKYEVTLKLDGSSCTVFYRDGEVGVCSRNQMLQLGEENAGNSFVKAATDTGLLDALKSLGRNIAVQAELVGGNIQSNSEKIPASKGLQLYVFDIFDIENYKYLTPSERAEVFNQIKENGFKGEHIPVIDYNIPLPGKNIQELQTYATGASIYNSMREGVVFKSMSGRFSFKVICPEWLMKHSS